MKKHVLFVAIAALFSVSVFADALKPTTVPAAPTKAEKNVMALYCNHYQGNTLKFAPAGWGSAWETLELEGTKVAYTANLDWDCIINGDGPHDLSAYEHLHFDIWAPAAAKVKVIAEAVADANFKEGVEFNLNAGWNTIDADPTWWKKDEVAYDWKTLKCILFEGYVIEGVEGKPFAFTNLYFWSETTEVTPPDVPATPIPEAAPAVPAHAEEDVMALYCNHYTTNNLNFYVQGWGGIQTWKTLDLDGTNVLYCEDMKYEFLTNWDAESYDFSGFEKLHFDVWVPFAAHIKLGFEAKDGTKSAIDFKVNEGWNTIDADPAWWSTEELTYDWKAVKYLYFEGYKKADAENLDDCTSAEGNPFAFANLYWWKSPAPAIPEVAPANPTLAEANVQALFSAAYQENTFDFAPQNWGGTSWIEYEYPTGEQIFCTNALYFDACTNWGADHYDLTHNPVFDMFHIDIFVQADAKIKITFEALGAGDGGSGWKNGASVDLKGGEWNSIAVDLLNAPYDSYDFTDMRYLILEAFQNPDGSSAEGTPVSIANAYFYSSMNEAVDKVEISEKAIKRILNGQLVIEKNGIRYNAQGTQF